MPKHSSRAAVTSWEDTVKFAQLLLGTDARVENYADRLPRSSTNSFLLFARGACRAPRPLSGIANVIPAQLSEIKNYEIGKRRNFHNPLKSQQMLARKGALVYYYSCQVTRDPCSCRSVFGADAHQECIPTV